MALLIILIVWFIISILCVLFFNFTKKYWIDGKIITNDDDLSAFFSIIPFLNVFFLALNILILFVDKFYCVLKKISNIKAKEE